MYKTNGHRAFANRAGNSVHRAGADIARRENAGTARFE